MRQLRVYSEGGPGTLGSSAIKIIDEDGNQVEGVMSATIWMDPADPVRIDLEIQSPIVNVAATVDTVTLYCPVCRDNIEHECPQSISGKISQLNP